jgi:hypothetical protein
MADVPEIHDVRMDIAKQNRIRRIERERAMLAEGAAQIARGEVYDWSVVQAWMAALEIDPDAELPSSPERS